MRIKIIKAPSGAAFPPDVSEAMLGRVFSAEPIVIPGPTQRSGGEGKAYRIEASHGEEVLRQAGLNDQADSLSGFAQGSKTGLLFRPEYCEVLN